MATTCWNSEKSCWSRSLWCVTTCNGLRVPKVAPADPIPTVSSSNERKKIPKKPIQEEPKTSPTGILNQFYAPDENGQIPTTAGTSATVAVPSTSRDFYLENSIFIEIDKDRRIRVVHLSSRNQEESKKSPEDDKNKTGGEPSVIPVILSRDNSPKKPEEEDEYWFTKWTRKPRFRSIFENNTIHGSTEEDEGDNNNSSITSNGGSISKDFEIARAQAEAKRRAWAYNNGPYESSAVPQTTMVSDNDDEFNTIKISRTLQKWSKGGNVSKTPQNDDHSTNSGGSGITNLGFEDDDDDDKFQATLEVEEQEVIHERAVDCPPDFVPPVKNLSLKRGTPSPSPSSSSTLSASDRKKSPIGKTPSPSPPERRQGHNSPKEEVPKVIDTTPVIFFVHGLCESSDVWNAQMDYFHGLGYEVVAPDLLGHGFSSTPSNAKYYQFESLAQDLLSVFDYFIEDERKAVVIGHGYGACLASVIVRVRPKPCNVLISVSGGGPTPLVERPCCRGSLIPFYCRLFHTYSKSGRFDNPELRHALPSVIHEYLVKGQVWTDGDSSFYRRISIPTLLVYGMKDKVVNLVEVCEMERTIPKSFLEVVDSAGHMVMIDDSARLNKMLGKFIKSWL